MDWERMKDWIKSHQGKVIGGVAGLLVAILILTINFWRTLLLFTLIGLGVYLGSYLDHGNQLRAFMEKIFKTKTR